MHTRAALSIIVIAVAVSSWSAVLKGGVGGLLHVYVLDVGQGDAIYVRTPRGADILIDGGPGGKVITELARVMPPGDKHLDVVMLTHPHFDHTSGLERIFEAYEVSHIFSPTGMPAGGVADTFLRSAEKESAQMFAVDAGDRIVLDTDTSLDILLPTDSAFLRTTKNPNEWSIVAKLMHRDATMLLTGDAERREELLLLRSDVDLSSDVLKVAHHGSAYASIAGLLERIRPNLAAVSVGKNTYGHPNAETLTRLTTAGAEVLRTDEQGTIHFVSDGVQFWVETGN
jgi:competence protein ComEC